MLTTWIATGPAPLPPPAPAATVVAAPPSRRVMAGGATCAGGLKAGKAMAALGAATTGVRQRQRVRLSPGKQVAQTAPALVALSAKQRVDRGSCRVQGSATVTVRVTGAAERPVQSVAE